MAEQLPGAVRAGARRQQPARSSSSPTRGWRRAPRPPATSSGASRPSSTWSRRCRETLAQGRGAAPRGRDRPARVARRCWPSRSTSSGRAPTSCAARPQALVTGAAAARGAGPVGRAPAPPGRGARGDDPALRLRRAGGAPPPTAPSGRTWSYGWPAARTSSSTPRCPWPPTWRPPRADDPGVSRLDAHARHLREHVDRLAAKSYWQAFNPRAGVRRPVHAGRGVPCAGAGARPRAAGVRDAPPGAHRHADDADHACCARRTTRGSRRRCRRTPARCSSWAGSCTSGSARWAATSTSWAVR